MSPFTPRSNPYLILPSLLVCLLASLMGTRAHAQPALCAPYASGVPGLSGSSPQWLSGTTSPRLDINDPRWQGAARFSFAAGNLVGGGSDASEAHVRILREPSASGDVLIFSFQALADPTRVSAGYDAIYLGFAPQDHSAPAKLVRFSLLADPGTPAAPGTSSNRSLAFFQRSAPASWTGAPPGTSWVTGDAVWVRPPGGSSDTRFGNADWAVHFRVPVNALGFGALPLKTFFAFQVQHITSPPTGAPTGWVALSYPASGSGWWFNPSASPPPSPSVLDPIDPTSWVNLDLTNTCASGVSIDSTSIGTTNTPSSVIYQSAPNTFFANPNYNGLSLPAGTVRARFRLANWGSQVDDNTSWAEFGSGQNSATSSGGGIQYGCVQTSGASNQCPQRGANDEHQCMLVQLEGAGATPVQFARDSAYRNMDFVSNSVFERNAEINIAPLPTTAQGYRDVYVYVKTRNMPSAGEKPFSLPVEEMMRAQREVSLGPIPERDGRERDLRKARPRRTVPARADGKVDEWAALSNAYEKLTAAWPTYEVHVYHDTLNGTPQTQQLAPQLPFGYYVSHTGQLYGFEHKLEGAHGTVVQELLPGYYRLTIRDGGSATVHTRIASVDQAPAASCPSPCPACPPPDGCASRCSATSASPGVLSTLAILGFLGLFLVRWQRRRRSH